MATKQKKTYVKFLTPVGKAAYAWLQTPDAKFNPDNPKYKITLLLPEGPAAEALEAQIHQAMVDTAAKDGVRLKKNASLPVKHWEDDEEDKRKPEFQGLVRFTFKGTKRPTCVDSGKPPQVLPESIKIMSGDMVRVSVSVTHWATALGCGATVYLNGVQLIEKLNTGGNAADDFDGVEGGYTSPDADDDEQNPL